jgi:hypothetical protein
MREFRQTKGRTGLRYWQIGFEAPPGKPPEVIVTAWGAVTKEGKRKQHGTTKDRPGPKGKKGTKSHMTASENACFNMDRLIRKKMEEGYQEVGLDGRPLVGGPADEAAVIPFDDILPKNLCFSKPRNTVPEKFVQTLEDKGNLLLTRKMNGMMVIAQICGGATIRLYTRRMDQITDHFPHLTLALLNLNIPPETILLFEAFLGEGNTKRDLLRVQSVMRSKSDRALRVQEDDEWMKFYLFRIPVWKGQLLEKINNCEQQCHLIENTFADKFMDYEDATAGRILYALENFEGTLEEADAEALELGYEGWVGYQRDAVMGDYSFSFHGKPDRPGCCFKRKPEYEDDFLAFFKPDAEGDFKQGSWGTGKNTGKLGTMSLYQMDPETGEVIYICEVGSGFTDKQREELRDAKYPMVVTVKYTSRSYTSEGDDTNALEFPRFDQIHPDKTEDEVYNPKIQSA